MIYGHAFETLPSTIIDETLNMAHIAAHLDARIILVGDSVAVRYKLPFPSYCRYHFCETDVKLD